jgi:diketogulonate reductase-like aldo/keto reductase
MVVKSFKRERLEENTMIFHWELSDEDRLKISQMLQQKMATVTGLLCPDGVSSVDIAEVDVVEM